MMKLQYLPAIFLLLFPMLLGICRGEQTNPWESAGGYYPNAKDSTGLTVHYLQKNDVLFVFSPSEKAASFSGVFHFGKDGKGYFEKGNENLLFTIKNGVILVGQPGPAEQQVSAYGPRSFSSEADEALCIALLNYLPSEKTGLNVKKGLQYNFQNKLVDFWFHSVEAIGDGGKKETFYLARDLSSLYRLTEGVPTLIFGSARSMMNREDVYYVEERNFVSEEDNKKGIVGMDSPIVHDERLIVVECEPAGPEIGSYAHFKVRTPGNLPFLLKAQSEHPEIISVEKDGRLYAAKEGVSRIFGTVTVDDASKPFSFFLETAKPSIEFLVTQPLTPGQTVSPAARINGLSSPPKLHLRAEDGSVAAVGENTLTALRPGETAIHIFTGGDRPLEETFTLYVEDLPDGPERQNGDGFPLLIPIILAAAAGIALFAAGKRRAQ